MDRQTNIVVAGGAGGRGGRPAWWRVLAAVLVLAALAAALAVWGGDGGGDGALGVADGGDEALGGEGAVFRYVNSGWVSPLDGGDYGAFSGVLRAFVLGSEAELAAFEGGLAVRVSRGSAVSLGRIEFEGSVLLAAYYVWRPVRGDPLSVSGVRVDGGSGRAVVSLELDREPQGREYPYLLAPMVMVAVGRSAFPAGAAVEFVFELDGAAADVVTAVPNPGGG